MIQRTKAHAENAIKIHQSWGAAIAVNLASVVTKQEMRMPVKQAAVFFIMKQIGVPARNVRPRPSPNAPLMTSVANVNTVIPILSLEERVSHSVIGGRIAPQSAFPVPIAAPASLIAADKPAYKSCNAGRIQMIPLIAALWMMNVSMISVAVAHSPVRPMQMVSKVANPPMEFLA